MEPGSSLRVISQMFGVKYEETEQSTEEEA